MALYSLCFSVAIPRVCCEKLSKGYNATLVRPSLPTQARYRHKKSTSSKNPKLIPRRCPTTDGRSQAATCQWRCTKSFGQRALHQYKSCCFLLLLALTPPSHEGWPVGPLFEEMPWRDRKFVATTHNN